MRARDLGSFLYYWIVLLVCSCLQIFGITVAVKIVYMYQCVEIPHTLLCALSIILMS